MQNIIIPYPLQITMDDLGWFCGTDGRTKMEPARTGITRRHVAEDYEVVNEIGKRLGMRINCAFVMGEWDPDNRLKSIPHLSPYGEKWNNAAFFNEKEAKRCVDIINSSDHIDVAVHGVHHTYFLPEGEYNNSDYYYTKDGRSYPAPEEEIRMRLDTFYDLIEYHGIKKHINSFIPPNFDYSADHLAKILKDYGILYISTIFNKVHREDFDSEVTIDNGITVMDRNNCLVPWNEMESDLDSLPVVSGIFGCHWANVCHKNPKQNYTLVDSWVRYFNRCQNTFGIILSEDIGFCAAQSVYKKYSKTSFSDGKYTIDLTDVPTVKGIGTSFYISSGLPLTQWSGCDMEIYRSFDGFINYRVTPKDKILIVS